MSRWREMMMDYGQVFGSEKSGPGESSNAFTLNSGPKDTRNADLQMRRTLEVHFRPLFQRFVYGGEKIACHDLRRVLGDPEYRDHLPPDKLHELADVADFNRGKAISYTEFANIVLNHLPLDDLASQGSLNDLSTGYGGLHGPGGNWDALCLICRNTTAQEVVEEKMESYRCLPPPFFMVLISLAQIIVYIAMNGANDVSSEALEGVPSGNDLMYMPTKRREAWRWLTYCLLHQGYVDLIFNVVIQLVLGIPLEMMFSWWRMAIVYFAGVIVGSCGHSIADHYVGLVGAAGGSYAIVAAHIMAIVFNWKHFNKDNTESSTTRFLCSTTLRIVVILLVVIAQFVLAIYRRFIMADIDMKVGIAAHIGGLIAGASLSDAFLADPRRSPMKAGAAVLSLFSFLFLLGLTVVLNIVWEDYPDEVYR